MEIRRHLPCAVMGCGALVAVWGSFRPWLASGSAERTSYELVGVVDRLGVGGSGPFAWAVTLWPLMPLLLVSATVITWWGRRRLGAATGIVGGAYAATVALGTILAPGDGLLRSLHGTVVTLVGAVVFLAGVTAVLAVGSVGASVDGATGVEPHPA